MTNIDERHIKALATALDPFYSNVEIIYNWKTRPTSLPEELDLSEVGTSFQKNLVIRDFIHQRIKISDQEEKKSLFKWVIHNWGGIRSFQAFEIIPAFLEELESGHLTWKSSSRISSLSKIAAFISPDQYAIYDARVSIALNWLLYLDTDYSGPFFKDLSTKSRNSQIIPDLKWDRRTTRSGALIKYLPNSTFYFTYNQLLRQLADHIDPGNTDLFQRLEMTLFSLPLQEKFRNRVLTIREKEYT